MVWGRDHRRALVAALTLSAVACNDEPPPDPLVEKLAPVIEAEEPEPEIEPELLGLVVPSIEKARVRRRGRKVNVEVRWSRIDGARSYEVQLAKILTFSRLQDEAQVVRTRHKFKRLKPGVYFCRVRAIKAEGASAFSKIEIIDATRVRKKRTAPEPGEEDDDAVDGLVVAVPEAPAPVTGGPLRVAWREPRDQAIFRRPGINLRGESTRGAVLIVNDGTRVESVGPFDVPIKLRHGRNVITLVAELGGQRERLTRNVFYADPRELGPLKERFERLRRELVKIRSLRRDLITTVRTLEKAIEGRTGEEVDQLRDELERIEATRRSLDDEVGRAIEELDQLLTPTAP